MWYELWDMSLEMLLDEGDDPTLVLELLRELIDELEPDDLDDLMLVERHPALQAESFSHGANVIGREGTSARHLTPTSPWRRGRPSTDVPCMVQFG